MMITQNTAIYWGNKNMVIQERSVIVKREVANRWTINESGETQSQWMITTHRWCLLPIDDDGYFPQ